MNPMPAVENVEAFALPPVTVAVCSNRLRLIECFWALNKELLTAPGVHVLVVLDLPESLEVQAVARQLRGDGAVCLVNRQNLGLATSRNLALEHCRTQHIVFVDDDVAIDSATLPRVREAFASGIGVVGVRIRGPQTPLKLPWYVSSGQLHYLGIHSETSTSVWGACMGFCVMTARKHNLTFWRRLGRGRGRLLSGEDTSFVQAMTDVGAPSTFLSDVHVHHNIDHGRLALVYLVRRAYWQGRTEYRRRNVGQGVLKELKRNFSAVDPISRLVLGPLFTGCVVLGVIAEWLLNAFGRTD
jgi:hypothetical protein